MSKNIFGIVMAFLLLTGLCLFSYGILSIVGSTSAQGNSAWFGYGIGFSIVGVVFLVGAGISLYKNIKTNSVAAQSGKIDLPGEVQIKDMKCKNCGGSINAANIQMINGVPVVVCPWCDAHYQLSEEPKW
ncbi:MAG TPA: hypothetical protein VN226_00475 [Anaerolineales bacterium]|nr:hypothetical protein [Anaerolineales bacterium]